MNGLTDDPPPDAPKPPAPVPAAAAPAPVPPAMAPFVAKLPAADAASLHAIGETIARQLNQTQDENQRRFLVDAGRRVLAEINRREASQPAVPERSFVKPDIEKTAYRQALSIANRTVGLVNAGNIGAPQDPIKEISRSAWEGGEQNGGAVVSPSGTNFFSHGVSAPANNGAVNPAGASPVETSSPQHLIYVPPPPPRNPAAPASKKVCASRSIPRRCVSPKSVYRRSTRWKINSATPERQTMFRKAWPGSTVE